MEKLLMLPFDSVNQCIYITGHFVNQITFPGLTTLFGYSDIFLAKMDLNGNFIWAKKAGGFGLVMISSSLCKSLWKNLFSEHIHRIHAIMIISILALEVP
jgi:hypothetical protein